MIFLKTAFRSLAKRKGYTLLNIFGLTLGMASCLLIFKYVAYERSYDHFQRRSGEVYRIQLEDYQNGQLAVRAASNYAALAPALKQDFPEIEETTRFFTTRMLLSNDEKNIRFYENKIYYAEPSFLDLFDLHFLSGGTRSALQGPDKIVISETMAVKYFGTPDALGKIISMRNYGRILNFQVTGVFQEYPANSHVNFSALVSYNTFSELNRTLGTQDDPVETSWFWTDFYTYIRLKPGADAKKLEAALPAFAERHVNHLADNLVNHDRSVFRMMPLQDIHLYSHYTEEAEPPGDGKSLAFLFLTGFIILGIAWVNYINMATARSLERAREVGVRKLLGAVRRNIMFQFMMESILINGMALVLSIALSIFLLKPFELVCGRPLGVLFDMPANYLFSFGALFLAGSFLSGIYPAFVLSGFNPAVVLKGLFKNSNKGIWLRKGLIVGQFATSIILIAGTIIIYRQVHFMRNQKLGVNIDRTLVVHGAPSIRDSVSQMLYPSFKNDVLALPGVTHITSSSNVMGQEILWSTNWKAQNEKKLGSVNIFQMAIDYDFLSGYGLQLVSGRNFSRDFPTDKSAALLNASAVRSLGFKSPEDALQQTIISMNGDTMHVTGVVQDFHQEGLQKEIAPLVLFLSPRSRNAYSIKLNPTQSAATIPSLKKIWDHYFPADPFSYFFLDDFFDHQYDENKRFGDVFGIFSVLAICIACLGLLALSAYNVLQRTKEIGIRKVLGASVRDLVLTLSKDFAFLVLIAFVIAIPVSFWTMSHWLQSFAYRIQIGWWIYALAGFISFFIAFITLSYQAVKAAQANPVNSLRSE